MKGKAMSQNENLQPEAADNNAPQVQEDIELKVLNNADSNNGETTESGCCGVCGG
jgi:hypothetical protein